VFRREPVARFKHVAVGQVDVGAIGLAGRAAGASLCVSYRDAGAIRCNGHAGFLVKVPGRLREFIAERRIHRDPFAERFRRNFKPRAICVATTFVTTELLGVLLRGIFEKYF